MRGGEQRKIIKETEGPQSSFGGDVTLEESPSEVSGESGDLIGRGTRVDGEKRVKCYLGGCIWICSDALDRTTMVLVPA